MIKFTSYTLGIPKNLLPLKYFVRPIYSLPSMLYMGSFIEGYLKGISTFVIRSVFDQGRHISFPTFWTGWYERGVFEWGTQLSH